MADGAAPSERSEEARDTSGGPPGVSAAPGPRAASLQRRSQRLWWVLALYSGAIFLGSVRPVADVASAGPPGADKVVHFVLFAVWAMLCLGALGRSFPGLPGIRRSIVAFLATCAFGLVDELQQTLFPWRASDAWDLLADLLGACAGVALYGVVFRRWKPGQSGPVRGGVPAEDVE